MKKSVFVCVVLFIIGTCYGIVVPPEPAHCALCGAEVPHHAPCVLNVSTGVITELAIYEPSPGRPGELAKTQEPCQIFRFAGQEYLPLSVDRLPDLQRCATSLPASGGAVRKRLFCAVCRRRLSGARGYVLVDLYDLENIAVYPISAGAVYTLRDYTVSLRENGSRIAVEVSADLF